ncbi:MAG TPA: CarD family transcriptional regulator, partial [Pseudomonadales bacterium]
MSDPQAANSARAYPAFSPPAAPGAGQHLGWQGLLGSAAAIPVAAATRARDDLTVVVTGNGDSARRWLAELEFVAPDVETLYFPEWETLAYDAFSPHEDIISERLGTLHRLPRDKRGARHLVITLPTLLQRLPPRRYVEGYTLKLAVGQTFRAQEERRQLESAGYRAVETVTSRGEFAVRGSLMDIFPMGSDAPLRIDLLDEEIESLRTFDPDSQRTINRVDRFELLPAKEFPLDPDAIARFRDNWHNTFNVDVRRCSVYQDVSQGISPSGVEYYLPLFFDELASLFDYLPPGTLIVADADLLAGARDYLKEVAQRFESLAHDVERPILPPADLFLREEELGGALKQRPLIDLVRPAKHCFRFHSRALPDLTANARAKDPAGALRLFLRDSQTPVLFVADTAGRREVFYEFLNRADLRPREVATLADFLAGDERLGLTIAPLERGLWLDELVVITENQVFGYQVAERRVRAARTLDPDQIIRNLTELHLGEPVVHMEHGIGRYLGLETLTIDGSPNEFLALAYADDAKLYVPVTSLHLISRYSGADADHAPLHRLGSDQWEKAKRRAAEKVHDVAAELLNIYARREVADRFAFSDPGEDYLRFAAQFPFELTPDQQTAIDEVIGDLCSKHSTDRLICGDVGFGKTEVAMRAAFLAVASGKQVAVLVPTTLLAQQHFETFRDRFADWPVTIEALSRMRSDSEID